jgi:hypothetical protein
MPENLHEYRQSGIFFALEECSMWQSEMKKIAR